MTVTCPKCRTRIETADTSFRLHQKLEAAEQRELELLAVIEKMKDCATCANWTGKFCGRAASCIDAHLYEQKARIMGWLHG